MLVSRFWLRRGEYGGTVPDWAGLGTGATVPEPARSGANLDGEFAESIHRKFEGDMGAA